jgi:predicted nucleotidyltransferase
MGQEEILHIFFENPTMDFQIRGIAKLLNISKTVTNYHIDRLVKENIILKQKKSVFPSYRANETSEIYRFYKTQNFLKKALLSGLLDYLEYECSPKCILLFGSFAKGEYDKDSDIDLFVQSSEQLLSLAKFEKRLKHKINLLFEPDLNKLSPELMNNILNGIKLRGYIKWKK